jgi:peptidyl-tRNA hydrolase
MAIDNYIDGANFKKKDNYMIVEKVINGEKILFVKPLTYMNDSGQAVRKVMDYYKINLEDILIIYDDRLDIYEQRKRTYRTIYFNG